MRITFVLTGALILFVGGCSNNDNKAPHAPPVPDKVWVIGKWKNNAEMQFLNGFEFSKDGEVKLMFRDMKGPIVCRYTWSSERDVDVEYPKTSEIQKNYEEAAKAYKAGIEAGIKAGKVDGRARPTLLGLVTDKMPEKETYRVGITDPKYLVLSRKIHVAKEGTEGFEKMVTLDLEKVD